MRLNMIQCVSLSATARARRTTRVWNCAADPGKIDLQELVTARGLDKPLKVQLVAE